METKQDLNNLLKDKIPSENIYKCCILDNEGEINTIIVFQGNNQEVNFDSPLFSEEERLFYKTTNPTIIVSNQFIHLDDSISTIKKKILKEFVSEKVSYEELYLYGYQNKELDLMNCYQEITNNDTIEFSKQMMGQFINNLQIESSEIYDELKNKPDNHNYSYDEIMQILMPYKNKFTNYYSIGQKFSSKTNYLFSSNPYCILPNNEPIFKIKKDNVIYSFENNLLLNYPTLTNNSLYICLAENVLHFGEANAIMEEYLLSLYFPLLSKQDINSKESLLENKQSLIDDTSLLIKPDVFKIHKNIDMFHSLKFLELNELPYIDNGLTKFHIVLHPVTRTFLPLDIIFKSINSTNEIPFIKYNPGSKRESLIRLYCNKRTKTGKKIPLLSKQELSYLFKNSGKIKELSICIKKIINTQLVECFLDFDTNGNIVLRSISSKHVSLDSLEQICLQTINPIIQNINSVIESSGYNIEMFKSLDNELVEIADLNYELSIMVNKNLDLTKYSNLFYGIFDILDYDLNKGANLRFKRVDNYSEMSAIFAMICYYTKTYVDDSSIINLLVENFNILYDEAEREFIKFRSQHIVINGKYVNKAAQIVDNPGIPCFLKIEPFENKLIIDIKSIDSIKYINILKTYFEGILRISQYDTDLPFDKNSYLNTIKKNTEIKDEPHIDNVITANKEIIPESIIATNIFVTGSDDEDDEDDDGLFFDTDEETVEENEDSIFEEDKEVSLENNDEELSLPSQADNIKDSITNVIQQQVSAESKTEEEEESKEDTETQETQETENKEDKESSIQENIQQTVDNTLEQASDMFNSVSKSLFPEKKTGGTNRMFIKKMKQLQPVLFKKTGNNEDSYARFCQANSSRQPVILSNEEKLKIDSESPGSYDIAMPYSTDSNKQYWYICPRYWCTQTNAPLTEKQVQDGECGGKIIPSNSKTAPPGHYIIEFTDKKEHIDRDGNYRKHYPGFLKNKTSDNHCLPCCFKKLNTEQQIKMRKDCNIEIDNYSGDPNQIRNILGEQNDSVQNDAVEKKLGKNIFLPERFPLPHHRWGFLNTALEQFLQIDYDNFVEKTNKAQIQKTKTPILRYGVEHSRNQSFVCCLHDLYYAKNKDKVSLDEFKQELASQINLDLFIKSHNGSLVKTFLPKKYTLNNNEVKLFTNSKFYKSLDLSIDSQDEFFKDTIASYLHFIKFLKDNDSYIDHTYLCDIVCSGKVDMFPEPFNIILFELSDADITNDVSIICPSNLQKNKLFDMTLNSVLLIKNNEYYEPIYKYGYTHANKIGNTNKTVVQFFNQSDFSNEMISVLKNIEHSTNKYCKPVQAINDIYDYKTNISAKEIVDILKDFNYTIKNQILNYNGKVIGIEMMIRDEDKTGFFVPTLPSGLLKDINIIYSNDIEWKSYEETKLALETLYNKTNSKIPCKPIAKIVEDGLVVGLLTLSNQFISISDFPENSIDDGLVEIKTSSYKEDYFNADKELALHNKKDNTRISIVRNIFLETQFYNSFRNKVRNLINDYYYYEIKKKIIELINDNSLLYKVKLNKLIIILRFLTKNYILFQEIDNDVLTSVNDKIALLTMEKENQFCLESENKLCIPNKHLVSEIDNEGYYYEKLADELLRYKRIQLFMLDTKQYLTIHNIGYKTNENEIILLQSLLFDEYLKNLVPFESTKYAENIGFDFSNPENHPPYSNKVNTEQIEEVNSDIDFFTTNCLKEIEPVNDSNIKNWEKFVSPNSSVMSYKESMKCQFHFVIHLIEKIKNIKININELKEKLIQRFNSLKETNLIPLYKILILKNKQDYVEKIRKQQITFETMIMNEEYNLTIFDLFILCQEYQLSVLLFSSDKLKLLSLPFEWAILYGNYQTDSFYFINYDETNSSFSLIEPSTLLEEMPDYENISKRTDFQEHILDINSFFDKSAIN